MKFYHMSKKSYNTEHEKQEIDEYNNNMKIIQNGFF